MSELHEIFHRNSNPNRGALGHSLIHCGATMIWPYALALESSHRIRARTLKLADSTILNTIERHVRLTVLLAAAIRRDCGGWPALSVSITPSLVPPLKSSDHLTSCRLTIDPSQHYMFQPSQQWRQPSPALLWEVTRHAIKEIGIIEEIEPRGASTDFGRPTVIRTTPIEHDPSAWIATRLFPPRPDSPQVSATSFHATPSDLDAWLLQHTGRLREQYSDRVLTATDYQKLTPFLEPLARDLLGVYLRSEDVSREMKIFALQQIERSSKPVPVEGPSPSAVVSSGGRKR